MNHCFLFYYSKGYFDNIALCGLGLEAPITRVHDTDSRALLARICIVLVIESSMCLPSESHLTRQGVGEEAIGGEGMISAADILLG